MKMVNVLFYGFSLTFCLFLSEMAFAFQDDFPLAMQEVTEAESHVSSSNTGANNRTGININELIGAHRFYDQGFIGNAAIVGNIESGHLDNGHEALNHVTEFFTGTGATGVEQSHATWVSHALSGRLSGSTYPNNYHGFGVARGSETWSGDIATAINGDGTFSTSNASTASVYSTFLKNGIGGQTVDVFNSSWGFDEPTGFNITTVGVDGFLNDTGKVGVVSAGNSGTGANTVGGIGAGYNSITVGSLGADFDANPYDRVSGFSSRGPNDFFDVLNDTTISGVRAAVDIVAPGQNMTLANDQTTNGYQSNRQGTSFSSPTVAGGTALMIDAGKTVYAGNSLAIDGRVIKANLLNGARKIAGWDNGQTVLANGTIQTTQSLDWASGAGALDLDQTYDQYINQANGGLAVTTDVAGTATGDLGNVGEVGWDYGFVGNDAGVNDSNLYFIDEQLLGGSSFTITLTWFVDMISGADENFAGAGTDHFADLNLTVFEFDSLTSRNRTRTVAQSVSMYNVVEHLFFDIDATGHYGFEVEYEDALWDFGDDNFGEFYAVSWRGTAVNSIPEPNSLLFLVLVGFVTTTRRRRS